MAADAIRDWWRRVRQNDARVAPPAVRELEERTNENELKIQALEESVRVLEIRHGIRRGRLDALDC